MKKFIAVTMATLMFVGNVFASEIRVTLNGENVVFTNQVPVIVEGRTLIPLRGVFEKLGYEIIWDAETKSAEFIKEGKKIKIAVNSTTFVVDDDMVFELDVPAQIINGSMMLPLRAVGEATGLDVNWDGAAKTVSLSSGNAEQTTEITTAEVTTEKTTEIITEEKKINGVPESELKLVQMAARSYVTFFSIEALVSSFMYNDSYNMDIAAEAMEYSGSDEEIEKAVNQAIAECERYKKVASELETGEIDARVVKKFTDLIDATIDDYKFFKNLYLTDMYDDLTDEQYEVKSQETVNAMKSALTSFMVSMEKAADDAWQIASSSKYNAPDEDKLSRKEKDSRDNYYKEIGKVAEKATKFINNSTGAKQHPEKFTNAANEIRDKINSTDTPDICVLDREIMLMCCDMLERAGANVRAAFKDDEISIEYIRFDYSLYTFDIMFKLVLEDNYTTKYFEEHNEEADTEITKDIENKFI